MEKYYLFLSLAFVSEVIGTISGLGSSILFVPVASLFFDFKTVLGITAVFHVFSNLSKIYLFREGFSKSIVIKLGIPAVIFVILGAWLTTYIPAKPMQVIMNLALIIMSVYLLRNFNQTVKQTNANLYIGGIASGLLAGLTGTGGAIRGVTLAAFNLPKTIFISTSALIDLGVDASRAAIYLTNGYFNRDYWILIPFLSFISLSGSYVGKVVLKYTSEKVFRYVVILIVMIASCVQFVSYFK